MEQYFHISGSIPAPDTGAILFPRSESVAVQGKPCSSEEVFLVAEPQHGYQRRPWSGILVRSNSLPQGHVVAETRIPRQGPQMKMREELEHFIDRVLVPILVARHLNRLTQVSLNSEIAQ